ncbi:lysozyme inhibitor LprI family protein [Kosakonia oryzae]|uniref:lysozyme inhibitor LprI family protein n=1 Tax=Kosakonia oryzae TaxID=497725 RepID=UPI001D0824D9|nr:lysozyme inhibitor LprI family protein [Kosakonia oryzae]UDJ84277.1 SEL1-like repeat protein [Kosakonia oryzae]
MKKTILAGLLCCISQMGHSASFNCEKAAGFVELTICSTPALSGMDSQLNALYNQLLQQQPENKALLRKSQLSWLKDIRNKATTIESLQTAYQSRIQDLQTLLGNNTAAVQAKPDTAPVAPQPAPVAAKSELETKAEAGDIAAQAAWGIELSKGTAQQKSEAIHWLESAAAQKNPAAMQRLGFLYTYGKSVTRDVDKGVALTRAAAEANDANAQIDLGYNYANGIGVEKDYQQALAWYEKAKANGSPLAERNIAAIKSNMEEEAKYRNGYTAIVTCGPVTAPGYVDNCFNDSDLKITKDNITTLYNMSSGNFPSAAGEAFSDGLHIKLPESFSVYAQNSMDNDVLMVKIVKNDSGKVVFQDQASKYGVISVRN